MSGFTTNPTLFKQSGATDYLAHAKQLVGLTEKCISIDGPEAVVVGMPSHVYVKVLARGVREVWGRTNLTAVCHERQLVPVEVLDPRGIISVFAGRIMDTGRDPQPVIDAAKQTGAQVLWASVREPYNIVQAEHAGCDIVTVPPAILRKYLAWNGKPLEVVAAETIDQFERDSAWT